MMFVGQSGPGAYERCVCHTAVPGVCSTRVLGGPCGRPEQKRRRRMSLRGPSVGCFAGVLRPALVHNVLHLIAGLASCDAAAGGCWLLSGFARSSCYGCSWQEEAPRHCPGMVVVAQTVSTQLLVLFWFCLDEPLRFLMHLLACSVARLACVQALGAQGLAGSLF
jgi:hypothetical protein